MLVALFLVLVATSGLLMASGRLPLPRLGAPFASASPTATPSPTVTPTPSPTPKPTPKPTATPQPIPPVYLGCGSRTLNPPSYPIDSGSSSSEVALTFDDGPSPDWTANMLTTLEQTHTPATFFVVGSNVQTYPKLVAREAADGFTIGIHTWDHPYMTQLTPAQRAWEIGATADAIHAVLGSNFCLPFWRPPFGDYNDAVLAQTYHMGLTTIVWDVDPRDWSSPGVSVIVSRVLSAAHGGSIILLHDGYFNRSQTAQALPQIIQGLAKRHLKTVTLAQLLGYPSQLAAAAAPLATRSGGPAGGPSEAQVPGGPRDIWWG